MQLNKQPSIHFYVELPEIVYSNNKFITCTGYIDSESFFDKVALFGNGKLIEAHDLSFHFNPSDEEVNDSKFGFNIPIETLWEDNQIEFKFEFSSANQKVVFDNFFSTKIDVEKIEKITPTNDVVVCMAMYNPDFAKFKRQIDSIYNQAYKNFDLIIQDDKSDPEIFSKVEKLITANPSTLLLKNKLNVGFYYNFNSLLNKVNGLYKYVLLCDQDDIWDREKISSQIEFLEATKSDLTYSDLKILNADLSIKFNSFWQHRSNHLNNKTALLLNNVATGSTLLFKGESLKEILPFPQKIGKVYHDHWILLSAMNARKVRYQDKAFVNYIQHENNVTGFKEFKREKWLERMLSFLSLINICLKLIFSKNLSAHRDFLVHYQVVYNVNYLRIKKWRQSLSPQNDEKLNGLFSRKNDGYYCGKFLYLSLIKSIKGIYTNRAEVAIYSSILINASIALRAKRKSLWKKKKQG